MKTFNAQEAKEIADGVENGDLYEILENIKINAAMGKTFYYGYTYANYKTLDAIRGRGFTVTTYTNAEYERDGICYRIDWSDV